MAEAPDNTGGAGRVGNAFGGGSAARRTVVIQAAPLCALGLVGLFAAVFSSAAYGVLLRLFSWLPDVIPVDGPPPAFVVLAVAGALCSAAAVAASFAGSVRTPRGLSLLRKGYVAVYLFTAVWTGTIFTVTVGTDPVTVFTRRLLWILPALLPAGAAAILHICSWRRSVINVYTGADETAPAAGDAVLEDIRTHGKDPAYRKSLLGSTAVHLFVIIIIPLLLRLYGCVEPYRIPLGSGNPTVAMVRVRTVKKQKRRQYVLAPGSPIIYEAPDLDDSELLKDVEKETELTYEARPNAAAGAMGTGGGTDAGWAGGFGDGVVRFIRLEYRGSSDWDDGMDSTTRADMNFLEKFRELAAFPPEKVADHPESHPIHYLRKYPKGEAPPFVYMTGSNRIHVSSSDIKIIRRYIEEGGMIFADCGGHRWDRDFRHFARRIFPGKPLIPIADDDPIFQYPYTFPHGPPPLWHHGREKTLGVKHRNRWAIFYYPGDLNDAWKSLKISGLDPALREQAFFLGTNILYHAFTRYLHETRKYRQ